MVYIVEGHYMRKCEEITSIYVITADSSTDAEEKVKQQDLNSPVADRTNYFTVYSFDGEIPKTPTLVYEQWREVS